MDRWFPEDMKRVRMWTEMREERGKRERERERESSMRE